MEPEESIAAPKGHGPPDSTAFSLQTKRFQGTAGRGHDRHRGPWQADACDGGRRHAPRCGSTSRDCSKKGKADESIPPATIRSGRWTNSPSAWGAQTKSHAESLQFAGRSYECTPRLAAVDDAADVLEEADVLRRGPAQPQGCSSDPDQGRSLSASLASAPGAAKTSSRAGATCGSSP
jgi:hypothetical protein